MAAAAAIRDNAVGRFDKTDFIYIAHDDEYQCPMGQRAILRFSREEAGLQIIYWSSSACPGGSMKAQCTTGEYRRIRRWEHEEVMDLVQGRLDHMPNAIKVGKRIVEHVFGMLKHWMGWTHFLTRGIERDNRDEPERVGVQLQTRSQHPGL